MGKAAHETAAVFPSSTDPGFEYINWMVKIRATRPCTLNSGDFAISTGQPISLAHNKREMLSHEYENICWTSIFTHRDSLSR